MKESMRLHPVIPMVVRTLMRAGDHRRLVDLPAGATSGRRSSSRHARARELPRARGRSGPSGSSARTRRTNTWIPFGGGVRRCIGAGFSLMEGVAVLREVLTAYDVTAVGDDEPKVRNITSVPRRGARIRVTRVARGFPRLTGERRTCQPGSRPTGAGFPGRPGNPAARNPVARHRAPGEHGCS